MSRAFGVLALVLTLTGCARPPEPGTGRTSSDIITRAEIASTSFDNAFDAVQRLRPLFLRARTTATSRTAYPVVYVDGIRRGAPEVLRTIAASTVAEIRYLSPAVASTRYGMNIVGGVIQVTTGRP